MTSPTPNPRLSKRSDHRNSFPAIQIVRRTAPTSRPFGRSAVGLRPSPDPDASLRRVPNTAKKQKNGHNILLTGPAPSGMTCTFVSQRHPTFFVVCQRLR
jgi:hypothetical protein